MSGVRRELSSRSTGLSRRDVLRTLTGGAGLIASGTMTGLAASDDPGTVPVPETELTYYLVPFDENGVERRWNGQLVSRAVTQRLASQPITDVFIFSHGWYGDIPTAKEQYSRWVRAMYDCEADRDAIRKAKPEFSPLLIGLHWPSLWFGDEELRASAVASDAANAARRADQEVDHLARRLANTPRARRALRTIVNAAQERPRAALSPDVCYAFKVLDTELRIPRQGIGGAPGTDRNPFDPQKTFQAIARIEGLAGAEDEHAAGWSLLDILRVFSFRVMKDRARHVGEVGGNRLLLALQNAVPPGRNVRFHLMGHSFGCIVVSATVAGPRSRVTLIRPVDSLTLMQGAYSLWSCCSSIPYAPSRAGYFRPLLTRRLVNGPIVTTQSSNDRAVSWWYPIAAGLYDQLAYGFPPYGGVGAFGLQGPGVNPVPLEIQNASANYRFEAGKVYNVESSSVISEIADFFMGAHSDIVHSQVAHIVWQAAMSQPQPYVPVAPQPVPPPSPPPTPPPQPQCRRRRRRCRRRC